MSNSSHKKSFTAGSLIIKEGEAGGDLKIIESGNVEVFQERDGQEIILAKLGPGEMLGVMTLLDDRKRAASVRAKTDVVINEIPAERVQSLVKEIPTWATSIIRDLVTRVHQADSLYASAKSTPGKQSIKGPHLSVAVRVAEGFAPLAEMLVEGGQTEIPIQKILDRLSKILGEPIELVTKIFSVFTNAKLMESTGTGTYVRSSMNGLFQLQKFSNFVDTNNEADRLAMLITSFTPGERNYLRKLIHTIELMGNALDRPVNIPIKKLEEALQSKKEKYEPHVIKGAAHLGLLKVSTEGDSTKITLTPADLRLNVSFIEALCRIDELEPEDHKLSNTRTLIY